MGSRTTVEYITTKYLFFSVSLKGLHNPHKGKQDRGCCANTLTQTGIVAVLVCENLNTKLQQIPNKDTYIVTEL